MALPTQHYVTLYKLPSFDSVDDFLRKVATVRGKLKKGGVVDVEATARIVLHDWNQGMCQAFKVYQSQTRAMHMIIFLQLYHKYIIIIIIVILYIYI